VPDITRSKQGIDEILCSVSNSNKDVESMISGNKMRSKKTSQRATKQTSSLGSPINNLIKV
jgi:hypothetical protein